MFADQGRRHQILRTGVTDGKYEGASARSDRAVTISGYMNSTKPGDAEEGIW